MSIQVLNIKSACEEVLSDFADINSGWRYIKSKKSFSRPISKLASIELSASYSSKVEFVNFQFGIIITHKIIKTINRLRSSAKPYADRLLYWHRQEWVPEALNRGRCTVYDHNNPYLKEYEALRAQGKKNYVRLEEFPEYLSKIFELAEAEIDRLFDLSTEKDLINSIVLQPLGMFPAEQMLIIHLLLADPNYYDRLVDYYDKPVENRLYRSGGPFYKQGADQIMELYKQGDFPKFDWI